MNLGKSCFNVAVAVLCVSLFWPLAAEANTGCPLSRVVEENSRVLAPSDPAVRGRSVEQLQLMLKRFDYYHGPVNGIYEPLSVEAVKEFQKKKGIKPDGVVEDVTWQALDEEYCQVTGSNDIPAPEGKVSILVDTAHRKLTVLSDGEPFKQYPVAVGKYETPSPVGNFKVLRRARNWGTGFGTRWVGLTVPWGIYGIHGTNKPGSIGSYASHGCIRMNNHNVEELYPWVQPGTRVVMLGNPFNYQDQQFRMLRRGARGGDVMEVQIRMQRLGFYDGPIDGIWGGGMERAVVNFRASKGLPKDNSVDSKVYKALGL